MTKKRGGHNLKWITREIIRHVQDGWADRPIATLLGCTTSTVIGVRSRLRAGQYKDLATPSTPIAPTPPSLAMIRLAEFDPVIARALAKRRGEAL